MTKYKFRIIGVPPEEAIKEIEVPDDATVKEVKALIAKELGLDPEIVDLNLIWNKSTED